MSAPDKDEKSLGKELSVQVCHANPWEPAFHPLREVIDAHDGDIRMAFAYVRKVAVTLLEPHADRMNRPGSFLIAAPEAATCDSALGALAELAPEFVYFHHGVKGVYQHEAPQWGGIMHSKVALSIGEKNATAWLGSHNLSERALGGINAEIAIRVDGDIEHPVLADIATHLDALRRTAKLWKPRGLKDEDESSRVLVLHVFSKDDSQLESGTFVHSTIPKELNAHFSPQTIFPELDVHVYIHKSEEALRKRVDPSDAIEAWHGVVTSSGHTLADSILPGRESKISGIGVEVHWPDGESPPHIKKSSGGDVGSEGDPRQIVVSIGERIPEENWPVDYSVVDVPVIERPEHELEKSTIPLEVPPEVEQYLDWKLGNIDKEFLHFEGDLSSEGKITVTGYEKKAHKQWDLKDKVPDGFKFEYISKKPNPKIQRYLYFSRRQWYAGNWFAG